MSTQMLSMVLAIAGLGCFILPVLMRVSGRWPDAATEEGQSSSINAMRSRLWWAGFMLTALALLVQRMASQAPGG